MKRFPLFCLLLSVLSASAFDATWNAVDFVAEPFTNARVWITPISPYGVSGNNVMVATRRNYTTDSDGVLTVTNMLPGFRYRVEFDGKYKSVVITNCFAHPSREL